MVVDLRGGDPHAVDGEMHRVLHPQVDGPVDARPGIPPGVLTGPATQPDGVHLAVAQERVEIDDELGVAVGLGGGEVVVHIDQGVAVHALELEGHPAVTPIHRGFERLGVLPHPGGEVADVVGGGGVALGADHGVVGQGDRLGLGLCPGQLRERVLFRTHGPARVERRSHRHLPSAQRRGMPFNSPCRGSVRP